MAIETLTTPKTVHDLAKRLENYGDVTEAVLGFVNEDMSSLRNGLRNTGDVLEELVKFINELSGEIATVKAWAQQSLAKEIENTSAQLRLELQDILARGIDAARDRAKAAERELNEIEKLMALPGQKKAMRLVHDSSGRTIGAVVSEVNKF
jgi:hypothetical protein